jgi:acetyl-CoA acetyltransferase
MRPETTIEILAKLPAAFKKDGTVTAGNASGIVDGGAALILASREAADRNQLKPLGRLVAWASTGVEPSLMAWAPRRPRGKRCHGPVSRSPISI